MTAQKPDATADPTREQLMVQWRDARRRREAADLGSVAYRRALEEIARIEIEIARIEIEITRIERAMDPPRA